VCSPPCFPLEKVQIFAALLGMASQLWPNPITGMGSEAWATTVEVPHLDVLFEAVRRQTEIFQ